MTYNRCYKAAEAALSGEGAEVFDDSARVSINTFVSLIDLIAEKHEGVNFQAGIADQKFWVSFEVPDFVLDDDDSNLEDPLLKLQTRVSMTHGSGDSVKIRVEFTP